MPIDWDAAGDFELVVDTLEGVVLKRRCGGHDVAVDAWRFSELAGAPDALGGGVSVRESVWQLAVGAGEAAPEPGDRLIDSGGLCWVVTRAERLRGETRWRCDARRVVLRRDLVEWFDLEEPIVDPGGGEPTITGWRVVRAALRGTVTPVRSEQDPATPALTSETYRITLTEPVVATANHRFRTHAGRLFVVAPRLELPGDGLVWEFDARLEVG